MYYSAPGINWDAVVARNKELLTRVVEMLFSLVIGLDEKGMVETLPRATHNYIHRILRPAESALRRLILIAARDIEPATLPLRAGEITAKPLAFARGGAAMPNSGPVFTGSRGLAGVVDRPTQKAPKKLLTRPPVFSLIDPRKQFHFGPRRRYGKTFPRITFMDGRDRTPIPEIKLPEPGDPVDAKRLCRRLIALKNALDNLDREALRLARRKARRGISCLSPMRPGYPPGRRKRPRYEIDEILKELHSWARYSEEPDSS